MIAVLLNLSRRSALLAVAIVGMLATWTSIAADARAHRLAGSRPNVILIITDDQGYGELACHGNPLIQTPNLDRLHASSVRFTSYHVSPTCAPTRAALLTGRHEFRSGVTHTIMQRERLSLEATTLAELLVDAGYETAIFGKWHLGDEKPYRPAQRGFCESFIHGAGGIGQSYPGSCGDFPGNSYFDPYVLHNERVTRTEGYCTDVFFRQALNWIAENRERPFFAMIATNAPHAPYICPAEYQQAYEEAGLDTKLAAYYGMITNIDDNVGKLLDQVDALGLREHTLVIFTTDNGHSVNRIFNAGMRGKKGTPYEGGTRVPLFFHWPDRLDAGQDIVALAAHIDFLPTMAELCGAALPNGVRLDGRSLVPLLEDPQAPWPDRMLMTHLGRWETGEAAASKYRQCAVRSQQFRLVNNQEFYDIQADPGEQHNVIDQHPHIVQQMRAAYDRWWEEVQPCLINEEVPLAEENAFAVLYREQFADD